MAEARGLRAAPPCLVATSVLSTTRNLLLDNGALQEYATHHVRGTWRLQRTAEILSR